jgi:hypothetical protein
LGRKVRNQNYIPEEIKRRLNMQNACHHSVQNFLSSHILSENIEIKIYKSVILHVNFMGVKLDLRE